MDTQQIEIGVSTLKDGFCGLTIVTHPKTRGKSPKIMKFSELLVILCSYESSVNRRIQKEGLEVPPFQAKALWNGKGRHISKHIVEHIDTKQRYLCYLPIKTLMQEFYADGEKVSKEEIQEFLVDSKPSKCQPQKNKVSWRCVNLENVVSIRQGENYEL